MLTIESPLTLRTFLKERKFMFYLCLVLIGLIWVGITLYLDKNSKMNSYEFDRIMAIALVAGSVIAALINSTVIVYNNIDDIESLGNYSRKLKIYIEKRDVLQKQYNIILDSTYGNYENHMYDKMTTKNSTSNIAVNIYPSPKYSETLVELTNKISELNENVYDIRCLQSNVIQEINVRYRNPFNITLFLPDKSETLKEIPANLLN